MTRKTPRPGAPAADDAALWAEVTRSVKPLKHNVSRAAEAVPEVRLKAAASAAAGAPLRARAVRTPDVSLEAFGPVRDQQDLRATPLDSSWNKKLRRGRMEVDATVDLHGMTQDAAHALLMRTLDSSLRRGDRILLVITGRGAPKTRGEVEDQIHGRQRADGDMAYMGERRRGVIKRELPKWIAHSAYANAVLAIRPAHPGHGGEGAYYVLLRRRRD